MSESTDVDLNEAGDSIPLKPAKRFKRHSVEWVVIIIVALVVSIGIRTFAFQTFYIPSGSMEPTLQVGDRIIVDKLSVEFGSIHTGDILVFKAPPSVDCGDPVVDLVKRVIGLPGDTISSKGNTIYLNGHAVDENWSHNEPLGTPISTTHLKADQYFMIGDNHDNSCDSRMWGTITKSDIIGKVFVRVWPLSRIAWI